MTNPAKRVAERVSQNAGLCVQVKCSTRIRARLWCFNFKTGIRCQEGSLKRRGLVQSSWQVATASVPS